MKGKGVVIRLGYMLLGALLTICIMLIREQYPVIEGQDVYVEAQELDEVEVITEDTGSQIPDYEVEAAKKLAQLDANLENQKLELASGQEEAGEPVPEIKSVSANSIEAAPVKWIKDYPMLNSDKLLEEKELERSSYEETLAVNTFDKKVIENCEIDFSDVKITILGDSLTFGSNLGDEEREKYAYPVILQEILGCKEIVNLGVGGSSVSSAGDHAMVERWSDVPRDSDIIIVFGGTNDCLFQNKWEFGELEYNRRMKEGTFCGDLDDMLARMEYVYRDHNDDNYCKLLYINPPSTILNDAVYAIDPGNMVHQRSFAEAINEIAPAYSFEVIDLYNNNILNTHDSNVKEQFMPDGVHANAEGYRILAEHIASQIIQRIEK